MKVLSIAIAAIKRTIESMFQTTAINGSPPALSLLEVNNSFHETIDPFANGESSILGDFSKVTIAIMNRAEKFAFEIVSAILTNKASNAIDMAIDIGNLSIPIVVNFIAWLN